MITKTTQRIGELAADLQKVQASFAEVKELVKEAHPDLVDLVRNELDTLHDLEIETRAELHDAAQILVALTVTPRAEFINMDKPLGKLLGELIEPFRTDLKRLAINREMQDVPVQDLAQAVNLLKPEKHYGVRYVNMVAAVRTGNAAIYFESKTTTNGSK